MKNITITLDEKTAAWARVEAAKHNKSVSRMVGEMLQKHMGESREYEEAMRRYLAVKPFIFEKPGGRLPTREELHDRASLRRR
jgi:plasmid stability protein